MIKDNNTTDANHKSDTNTTNKFSNFPKLTSLNNSLYDVNANLINLTNFTAVITKANKSTASYSN